MSAASIREHLETMARARIFFAHQSVGQNLLEGLFQLAQEQAIDALPVVDWSPGRPIPEGALAHAPVGRNTDPIGKIADFAAQLRAQESSPPDIALMKLCYVDFDPRSDAEAVFRHYSQTLGVLADEFPGVRFLHMTVPLKARIPNLKDRVKLLLGRSLWEDETNAVRERFNTSMRNRYPVNHIVDVARIEATFPDGSQCTVSVRGSPVSSMVPAYTYDGGHLNSIGQRLVAGEFARVIGSELGSS